MGDRVHLTMIIHPADLAKAIEQNSELRYLDEFDLDRIEYEMDEVNYGGTEDREKLAAAGVRFYGDHCAGGDYPAFDFYSDGKAQDEWPTDGDGSYGISVWTGESHKETPRLRETGTGATIEEANKYLAKQAAAVVEIDEAARAWSPPNDPWDELDQDALDEMVHDSWSQGASGINNQGRAKQISWLKSRGISP